VVARVSTFEGGTADGIRAAAREMDERVGEGPPEGVKSTGLTMLVDPDGGKVMMIGLFASENDLRDSEAALEQMNPPQGLGSRSSVETFELAAEVRM
jgi:hypothetical protein